MEELEENLEQSSQLKFKLDGFEGPLDLLLHLIKESNMSIKEVKIAEITDQYLKYNKLASMSKTDRTATLAKDKYKNMFSETLQKELKNKEEPDQFHVVKGAIEFGNIVGSVLGLAIFAPQVSHMIVHPTLKFFGFEREEEKNKQKIDTKA